MIYVYTDCDNAVACRDKEVLEKYFDDALNDPTFSQAKINTLPDDATTWQDLPIMPIDTWMSNDTPAGVLILVDTLSDLALLD